MDVLDQLATVMAMCLSPAQVMLQFFINKGLVAAGMVDKFSLAFWGLTAVALIAQALAVWLVLRLNRQHFGRREEIAVAAE